MKRTLVAVLAFGVMFAAVAGFAASMNVGGSNLGSGEGAVSECDDVTVAWGTPSFSGGVFVVTEVTIAEDNSDEGTPVHSCTGHSVSVHVNGTTVSGTLAGTPATDSLDLGPGIDAELINSIDVVVS